MNRLKGKVEAYVVSTMEDNQRTSLLDNLAISVEKVEDEAERNFKVNRSKLIYDNDIVKDFCDSLLSLLSHELKDKSPQTKHKSSFWYVAEKLSPKDIVQMIYRLDIIQSDSTRCKAWLRHTLKEGTMASFLSLLGEDTHLLKDFYKPSAFVRDSVKMESAKGLLSYTVSSVHFNIEIVESNKQQHLELPQEIQYTKRTNETSNTDVIIAPRRRKTRGSSVNIVTIGDNNKHDDNYSIQSSTSEDCNHSVCANAGIVEKTGILNGLIELSSETSANNQSSMYVNVDSIEDCNNISMMVENIPSHNSVEYVIANYTLESQIVNEVDNDCSVDESKIVNVSTSNYQDYVTNEEDVNEHNEVIKNGLIEDCLLVDGSQSFNESNVSSDSVVVNIGSVACQNDQFVSENQSTVVQISSMQPVSDRLNALSLKDTDFLRSSGDFDKSQSSNLIQKQRMAKAKILIEERVKFNHLVKFQSQCDESDKSIDEVLDHECMHYGHQNLNNISSEEFSVEAVTNVYSGVEINSDQDLSGSEKEFYDIKDPYDTLNLPGHDSKKILTLNNLNTNEGNEIDKNISSSCEALPEMISNLSNVLSENTIKICGSLTQSKYSAFNQVSDSNNESKNANDTSGYDSKLDLNKQKQKRIPNRIKTTNTASGIVSDTKHQDKLNRIINVIQNNDSLPTSKNNEILVASVCENKSEVHSPIEEESKNQESLFNNNSPIDKHEVKGSTQLVNILNNQEFKNETNENNKTEGYYIPGIHKASDVYSEHQQTKSIPVQPSPPKQTWNIRKSITSSFSPSSLSSSLKSIEKTVFRKHTRTSTMDSSDKMKEVSFDAFYSDSESDTCSTIDLNSLSILADLGITDDFIGLKEDHFSTPDSFMGFSSSEELENAISTCRQLIAKSGEKSQRRKDLVMQLIQLRLKLHEQKEKASQGGSVKVAKKVLGHRFEKQARIPTTTDCDTCGTGIFFLLQTSYLCKDCNFQCHRKCLKQLDKPCVKNTKMFAASYELRICPEMSLSMQQYRCADCSRRFIVNDGTFEVRLCDYTGQKYCSHCHWNEMVVIPARVIHNWDFSLYKVARQSKHLLQVLSYKPEINLQLVNPALFNFVEEVRDIRTLRQQIITMKVYLTTCRIAIEQRLLLLLKNRQHFVDNSNMYSLQDLIDIHENSLLDELTRRHAAYAKHIKFDCMLCHGKGFICEICNADEVIFPFDNHIIRCTCKGTFHRSCYTKGKCPKCKRNARRLSIGSKLS